MLIIVITIIYAIYYIYFSLLQYFKTLINNTTKSVYFKCIIICIIITIIYKNVIFSNILVLTYYL